MNRLMKTHSPWSWVPTLYFAEGLPYVVVMTLSLVMYKRMGVSNTEVALYTGWLNLPWVIKPLWSPFVDLLRTKRWWIVSMQLLIGAALAGVALTLPADGYFRYTLAFFLAHGVQLRHPRHCCRRVLHAGARHPPTGFLRGHPQHVLPHRHHRRTGSLIMLAGFLERYTGRIAYAWSLTFFLSAGVFIALWLYHAVTLPHPPSDASAKARPFIGLLKDFMQTFGSFFRKEHAATAILFICCSTACPKPSLPK